MPTAETPEHNRDDFRAATELAESYRRIRDEIGKVIIGQDSVVEELLIGLFARGHVLLVGVPGLAKTLLVSTVARISSLSFRRIQFTPDMMPSDITGTDILQDDPETGRRRFTFIAGPIFANMILADEINRTPPKTQAALLEAMQERHVTRRRRRPIPCPTRSSCWRRRTRSSRKGRIRCPKPSSTGSCSMCWSSIPPATRSSRSSSARPATRRPTPAVVLTAEQIVALQHLVRRIPVPDHVFQYARDLVRASRPQEPEAQAEMVRKCVSWGAGPRAGQSLILAAKARAVLARPAARRASPTSATSPSPCCGTGSSPPFTPKPKGSAPTNHRPAARGGTRRKRAGGRTLWSAAEPEPGDKPVTCPGRALVVAETHSERLDPDALARFGRLELLARLVVEGVMSGLHKSPFKGFSVEFAEHRQYGPGDEIRHIDWRAFGKTDRYYVKEYEEETNLKAMIVVDSSGSMGYAGRTVSKLEHARRMAASLAYLMISQRDAVGLVTFDTQVRSMIPPRSAPGHFSVICQALEATRTGGESRSRGILHALAERIRRRGLVIILSDGFDELDDSDLCAQAPEAPPSRGAVLSRAGARGRRVSVPQARCSFAISSGRITCCASTRRRSSAAYLERFRSFCRQLEGAGARDGGRLSPGLDGRAGREDAARLPVTAIAARGLTR